MYNLGETDSFCPPLTHEELRKSRKDLANDHRSRAIELEKLVRSMCHECERYWETKFGPSHEGSVMCRSGSLASGGTRAHCTCNTCF